MLRTHESAHLWLDSHRLDGTVTCKRRRERALPFGVESHGIQHTKEAVSERHRVEVAGAVGRHRRIRLRRVEEQGRYLQHRHAAADGERLASRRARIFVHAHRHDRAVPADAGQRGVLPDGVGRQRPADRAQGAELLRRAVRSYYPVRSRLRAARKAAQVGHCDISGKLHRAVPPPHPGRRKGVRGPLAQFGAVGRLVAHLRDHRRDGAEDFAAFLPQ